MVPDPGTTPLDAVKQTVKNAFALARVGNWDEFFAAYEALFLDPSFALNRPEDQRQALKLMIKAKGLPPAKDKGVTAFQAAWHAVSRLINEQPILLDYELLGLTHLRLTDEAGAKKLFETGYALAQEANDGDMCGEFLRYLSTM